MLEPETLQQLAIQTIYNNHTELHWRYLPNKLITILGLTETDWHVHDDSVQMYYIVFLFDLMIYIMF